MWTLIALALARPPTGEPQVVVVLKNADCPICLQQLRELREAHLPANLFGITHDPAPKAKAVSEATGVPTWSHAEGIRSMGLLRSESQATPAVVVYDKCGDEVGRLVGRGPGTDVTPQVRSMLAQSAKVSCGKPQS